MLYEVITIDRDRGNRCRLQDPGMPTVAVDAERYSTGGNSSLARAIAVA